MIALQYFYVRFVAYVAFKKENEKKKAESGKYFGYRTSEPDTNKFEYVDDWGEKYVGVVSLSLNVLDTVSGEISTVEGIDDSVWTVGQPVFLPMVSIDNTDNGSNGSEKKTNEGATKPLYRLSYTAWKNGPKKLGMIYCYQRECSIFVADLTEQLTTPLPPLSSSPAPIQTKTLTTDNLSGVNETENISETSSPKTNNLGHKAHVLVTTGVKLARSARFSPNGKKMIFLGSREGFSSHSGCSELLSVEVEDIVQSLNNNIKGDIDISTIIPTIGGSTANFKESSTNSKDQKAFPGIYSDQLPRNCFLTDDLVVITSPWGSVESLVTVDLATKVVERIILPSNSPSKDGILSKYESNSCSILDISRVKTIHESKDATAVTRLLLVTSSPSSLPMIGVLTMEINNKKNMALSFNTPSNYRPSLMPITLKKVAKKVTAAIDNTIIEKVSEVPVKNSNNFQ